MDVDESPPIFLILDEVLEIHQDQSERYGGSRDVLSLPALKSAIAQPHVRFGGHFLHRDVFEMAAVYLYHIAQNHPFADGNSAYDGGGDRLPH
jgi:death-on-curing protein